MTQDKNFSWAFINLGVFVNNQFSTIYLYTTICVINSKLEIQYYKLCATSNF